MGWREAPILQSSSNKYRLLIIVWTNCTIILRGGSLSITCVGTAILLLYSQSQRNWREYVNETQHHLEKKTSWPYAFGKFLPD